MSDRQAVFFDEYHLDVKVVWHGYHIASVPVIARGAQGRRIRDFEGARAPPEHTSAPSITKSTPSKLKKKLTKHIAKFISSKNIKI